MRKWTALCSEICPPTAWSFPHTWVLWIGYVHLSVCHMHGGRAVSVMPGVVTLSYITCTWGCSPLPKACYGSRCKPSAIAQPSNQGLLPAVCCRHACAQAVVAQVMLVGEAQQYVQQAEVPEELVTLEEVSLCQSSLIRNISGRKHAIMMVSSLRSGLYCSALGLSAVSQPQSVS